LSIRTTGALALAACALLSATSLPARASEASDVCDVHVRPGDGLVAIVDETHGGTVCIHAGTYRIGRQTLEPESYTTLLGDPVTLRPPGAISAPTRIVGSSRHGIIDMGKSRNVVLENLDVSGARGFRRKAWPKTKLHGRGIQHGENVTIRYVVSHDNAATGMSGLGRGSQLDHVELYGNGSRSYVGCCSAGVKSAQLFTIRHSYVHDNLGNGIWVDSGGSFIVTDNVVVRNSRNGIRYENGRGFAKILRNTVRGNSTSRARPGGGIEINSADDAEVAYNVLGDNFNAGIIFRGARRPVAGVAHHNVINRDAVKGCRLRSVLCRRNR
jgi:parallel beta-helix repeat protein